MLQEIIAPAASAVVGGGFVGLVAKSMIGSWFKQHEKMMESVQKMEIAMHGIDKEMRGMQVSIENFRKADDTIRLQDRALGIIGQRLERLEQDVSQITQQLRAGH